MMFEAMVAALALPDPGDLVSRTSSSARVQHVVQLSLAPAFLLAGIGAVMNVMTNRLIWVANRIERIMQLDEEDRAGTLVEDLPALEKRRVLAQRAVMLSTASAVSISVVIALLFTSAFVRPQMGTLIAIACIVTMLFLMAGLVTFLLETRTAARRNRERLKRSLRR